jgi:hypothetical protein
MEYWARLTLAIAAILLFACGLWANMGNAPMSEMKGAWVTQAMR